MPTALGGTGIRIGTEGDAGEARLRELARAEAAVADLGRRALQGAQTDELMRAAAETAVGMLRADLAAVFELLPERDDLRQPSATASTPTSRGSWCPAEHRRCRGSRIAENGPVVANELGAERRFALDELLTRYEVASASRSRSAAGRPLGCSPSTASRRGATSRTT